MGPAQSQTEVSVELDVRYAAEAYLSGRSTHAETVALEVSPSGELVSSVATTGGPEVGRIVSVLVLHAGNTAVAQVEWGSKRAGWLTLLLELGEWIVISAVSSSTSAAKSTPEDMAAAVKACWEEYGGANHACDGARMAEVFHPLCRLTFTGSDGSLVIKSQEAFVGMVSQRYTLPMHAPYAHLRGDPRIPAADELLSAHLATPDVCMVVMKVCTRAPPIASFSCPQPDPSIIPCTYRLATRRCSGPTCSRARASTAGGGGSSPSPRVASRCSRTRPDLPLI